LGQAICYDLRFPELFRRLVDQGAQIIAVPSAFTQATGRDHWEVLLRARAIENQVYVLAPNQYGRHTTTIQTYGRSMIIDPWGTVLATAPDGEGVITAELDPDRVEQVRLQIPALRNRRL
jgi:predicted amidohydrolase